jgi:4-amino-4-deoxy-L-arabinose transferase-like glycosyltransferase
MAGRLTPIARAALIALVALAIRAAFVLQFSDLPLFDANQVQGTDMEALTAWARRIAGGNLLSHGTGPYWWAPLFPHTLGAVFWLLGPTALVGAALAQAALGAATAALVYLLGRRLFDETTGLVAGLLAAGYGLSIFLTGIFLSTTLEVFLAVATLLALTRAREAPSAGRWFGAGLVAGLACLARPNFLLGSLAVWLLLPLEIRRANGSSDWPRARRAAALFLAGLFLAIAPATLRNWAVGGRLVLISAAGPETFRIANSYDSTPVNFIYPAQPAMPLASVAFWRHQARKALLFWWGFEAPQNVSYYLARSLTPILKWPWVPFWLVVPLAALGVWASRQRAPALRHVYIFLGAYYVSVVAFFIIGRWRLPLVMPLLAFSAAGLVALGRWGLKREWSRVALGGLLVLGLAALIHPGRGPFVFPADHGQLGYILANREDYAGAASHLERAAAGLPANGALHRDLGLLLQRLGRTAEARTALDRAVLLSPNDPRAHLALGGLLLAAGSDRRRASAHLERVLALAPESAAAAEARTLLRALLPAPQQP